MRPITFTKWMNILLIVFLCFTACQSESKPAATKKKAKTAQKSNKAAKKTGSKKPAEGAKKGKAASKKGDKVSFKLLKKDKSGKMLHNDKPFTGVAFKTSKGQTTAEISYKDGVKHGSYISYKNGQKKVTEFKKGKKVTK